jgi:hypothetical protein
MQIKDIFPPHLYHAQHNNQNEIVLRPKSESNI